MSGEAGGPDAWRGSILGSLRAQRENVAKNYATVFVSYAEVMEKLVALTAANERLRKDGGQSGDGSPDSEELRRQLQDLIQKKSINDQSLIDTKRRLEESETELGGLRNELTGAQVEADLLRKRAAALEKELESVREASQLLKDEHLCLQATCSGLEEKNRQVEEENRALIERWKELKEKEVDAMNAQVEETARLQRAKMEERLQAAGSKNVPVLDELTMGLEALGGGSGALAFGASHVPSQCKLKFDAHENEVTAVRWTPSGKRLATGGADRKIGVWEIHENGRQDRVATLTGANQTVTSLDWDADEAQLIAASNDFTSRIWTVADQRNRHTLTGHSGKVLAATFVGRGTQAVSGSHDRTLKQWDLRSSRCLRTLFVGSSCADLAAADERGSAIISAHFDKKLRFWDLRTESASCEVLLGGKVTSVSMSGDGTALLAATRNDSLSLVDLRTNSVLHNYAAESFRIGFDFTRAALSPDGAYAACGGADGSVFVWDVHSTKIERILSGKKGHGDKGVIACAWHPQGLGFVSTDKARGVCYWSDY